MKTTLDVSHPRYPKIAVALLVVAIASSIQTTLAYYPYGIAGEELAFAIDVTIGAVITWVWTYWAALAIGWIVRRVGR